MKLQHPFLADRWWKAVSTWLLAAAVVVGELSVFLPEIEQALPADWYRIAFRVILVARVINQNFRRGGSDAPR